MQCEATSIGEITAAIDRLNSEDFADRYRLERAADRLRSAPSGFDAAGQVTSEWAEQAVRTLGEADARARRSNRVQPTISPSPSLEDAPTGSHVAWS